MNKKDRYDKFRKDMEDAGYEVIEYGGRYFYQGPAVTTSKDEDIDLQDIIRATDLRLQWDNLGFDKVVYPE